MSAGVDETAPPVAPEPKPNPFARIVGVLIAPDETFAGIARRPDWLVPLLIFIALSITSVVLLTPRIDFASTIREAMEAQNRHADPRALHFAVSFARIFFYIAPVIAIIATVIVALLLLVAFRMFGGEGGFKQAFSVVVYSWIPQMIASAIGLAVLLSRKTLTLVDLQAPIRSNLNFLFDMKKEPLMFALSGTLDVFSFWTLVLLTIGFSHVSRFSKGKSAAIVIVLWVLLTCMKLIGPLIAQMRLGS